MSSLRNLRHLVKLCTTYNVAKNANRFLHQTKLSTCLVGSQKLNNFSLQEIQYRFYSDGVKLTQNQIEEKVMNILNNFDRIRENPSKPKVTLESHIIKELGLDSLDHVEIIVQLEDTFGYEIPDSEYEKLYTPKEIVNYILKRTNEA